MKNFFIFFSLVFSLSSFGQDLNKYSYVVVPEKFSFLKEADQYQINSLTKFLFEKNGFRAFLEGEEAYVTLNPDRCEGLYADVTSDSGLFRTKLNIILKDCRNQQVFISREGVSREKDYKAAYQDALREAFKSIEDLGYINNEVIVTGTPDLKVHAQAEKPAALNSSAEEKREQSSVQTSSDGNRSSNPVSTSAEINQTKTVQTPAENNVEKTSEVKATDPSIKTPQMKFVREGRNYFLLKTGKGFNIFQEGMTEPFATLISSSAGKNFVYSSLTSKGMAHLDSESNLVIEILKEDNSLETIIYKAKDQ